jgi:nicotinamide-nucleotide amidase
MQAMFLEVAIPLLAKHFPVRARFQTKEILLCLVKELELDPLLRHIQEKNPDAKIGIYPSLGMLSLRFQVSYRFERLELWESMVLKEFSSYVVQAQSLEVSVHQKLIETKKTLALAESCTGGLITSRLVALSGASEYLLGSMVVYSNAWKEQFLGVNAATIKKFGAVSKETAIEMVQGLLGLTAADYALAATGVAGPTGGTAAHPVGTIFIALAERGGAIDAGYIHAPLDRASALELTVQTALGVLWRKLAYTVATFS